MPDSKCRVCLHDATEPFPLAHEKFPLARCRACLTVQRQDAGWTVESAQAYYHDYYAAALPIFDPITDSRYHAILDRLEKVAPAKGRLVEVGAGRGHFSTVAEQRGWSVVAVEISASGVELLGQIKRARGWRFEVRNEDILRTALPAGSFQVATLFEVIEHVTAPGHYVRALARLLAPGGVLYLTTPNFGSLSRRLLGARWRVVAEEHLFLFDEGSMRRLLESNGFRVDLLRSKNIDLAEIRAKWGAWAQPVASAAARSQGLRRAVESSRGLSALKAAVNAGLGAFGLGDTLEVMAVRF